jgi:hypothetical protein
MNYLKIDYAKLKGVTPGRISQLIKSGFLETKTENGREMVVDCEHNNRLFKNPSWNSNRVSQGK